MNPYPKYVRDAIRLRKLFARLLDESRPNNVIGVREDYVQVTEQYISKLHDEFPDASFKVYRRPSWASKTITHEATLVLNGEKFLSVGTPEEFKAVGIDVEA